MPAHSDPSTDPQDGADPAIDGNIAETPIESSLADDPAHHGVPTHYAPRTGARLAMSLLVFAVTLGALFLVVRHVRAKKLEDLTAQTATDADDSETVDVAVIQRAPTTQPLALPGETRAWFESTIYARVSGYIAKWSVDIGDRVKKDDVLATIDTPELDAQYSAAQAKLVASQAEVVVQQANADFAKTTYDRFWNSPKGVVSDQERDEKKAEYATSIAKLNASQADVKNDQAEVASLAAQMKFKSVLAPYNGIITSRHIDFGDLVTAGSTNSTSPLFSIAQADKLRVFVDVPQNLASRIDQGQTAIVSADGSPPRSVTGKVSRTADSIDIASRTLRTEVDVDNTGLTILPGMYVNVAFQIPSRPTLVVPASAMIFRSTGPEVAVVDAHNRVNFRPVTISRDLGDVVLVTSGVSAGDRVALNLSSQVQEGDTVAAEETDANGSPTAVSDAGSSH